MPVLIKYIDVLGKPQIILRDNGTDFVNNIFSEFFNINRIEHRKTNNYNPAWNGACAEVANAIFCNLSILGKILI